MSCYPKNIRIGLLVVWLIIVALYIRFEAYPVWFTGTVPGYRGMFPENVLVRESWSRILIDNMPAGYAHSIINMDDDGPTPIFEISSRIHLRVRVLQTTQHIQVRSDIILDQDYQPQRFSLTAGSGDFTLRITGEHRADRRFSVTTTTGESSTTRDIQLPRDAVLFSPIYEMAIQQLRPGRSLAIRTLDPLTLQTATIMLTAGAHETLSIAGRPTRAMPIQSSWQGLTFRSWVDADGMMLRQETPFGWIMETSTSEEALLTLADSTPAPPLLRGTAGLSFLQTLIGTSTP